MQISAFVDGELPDNEADLLLRRMGQDAELRRTVAQFLAIGRALRGETSLVGADRMHERVSAAIDDKPLEPGVQPDAPAQNRALRPLAGAAIAATVALAAVFGLQQTISVDSDVPDALPATTAVEADSGYTIPQPMNDRLRQYYLSHGVTATENGANGINSRFVSLRFSEDVLEQSEPSPAADAADEESLLPKQP